MFNCGSLKVEFVIVKHVDLIIFLLFCYWSVLYMVYNLNSYSFSLQSKGDPKGAEEYYSRAILADPEDSEIISQYANLVRELYHDHDKALCYFERAVQAAPGDRYVSSQYSIISTCK